MAETSTATVNEIAVEFGDDMNSNPDFKPLSKSMRGRWDANNVPRGTTAKNSPLLRMPPLPGFYAYLDPANRSARLVDPLCLDEHASVKLAWQDYMPGLTGLPEEKYEDLSDDQIATWAYWIRRLVDKGEAVLLKGSAELIADQDLPGDPTISPTNARFNLPTTLEGMKLFLEHADLMKRLKRELGKEDVPEG